MNKEKEKSGLGQLISRALMKKNGKPELERENPGVLGGESRLRTRWRD